MSSRLIRTGLPVALLAVSAWASGGIVAAQQPPAIAMDPSTATPGQQVMVRGLSWPGGAQVHLELCGNEGLRGTPDCAQSSSVIATAGPDGAFAAVMVLDTPPVPCPCVLKATGIDSTISVSLPVRIEGLPEMTPEARPAAVPDVSRQLVVLETRLTGESTWSTYFGAAPKRVLHVTVQNIGNVAVTDPNVVIAVGRGEDPTGIVDAPEIGTVQPGESTTMTVPITLDALAFGSYSVVGEIVGFTPPATFEATTSSYPWGLVVLALLAAQAILLLVRNRVRRRVWRRQAEPAAASAPLTPEPTPALAPTVIDLDEPAALAPAATDLDEPATIELGPAQLDEQDRDQIALQLASAVVGALRAPTPTTTEPTDITEPAEEREPMSNHTEDAGAAEHPPEGPPGLSPEEPVIPGALGWLALDDPHAIDPDALGPDAGWVADPPTRGLNRLAASIQELASNLRDATEQQTSLLEEVGTTAAAATASARSQAEESSIAAVQRATRRYTEAREALDAVRADAEAMVDAAHERACELIAAAEAEAIAIIDTANLRLSALTGELPSPAAVIDLTAPHDVADEPDADVAAARDPQHT